MPSDASRNVDSRGTPVRLHEAHHGTSHEGDLIKIRMDEVPVKASLGGLVAPFKLGSDEGVGEQTAFLFHPGVGVLVLQRNRYGVSASALAYYFETLTGVGPIILEPILQLDALKRLGHMTEVRHFTVRVAGADARVLKDFGVGAREMAKLIGEFGAPNVTIDLSMGYQRGSMLVDQVKAAARRLVGLSSRDGAGAVTKIVVSGASDTADRTVLDLLNFRMEELVDVPTATRDLRYGQRRTALAEALGRRLTELKQLAGKD